MAGERVNAAKHILIAAFIICALPLGLVSAMLTPPGRVPDERTHVARAAGLLHGAVFAVRKEVISKATGLPRLTAGVKVDRGQYAAGTGVTTVIGGRTVVTGADLLAQRAPPPGDGMVFARIGNTAPYFPAPYVPAALGMLAGRLAGAPPFIGFLIARLFMLAAYLVLGVAALWVAGWGEALLLTVLILPMTVFLAGSVNPDGVLIALSCLGVACLTRTGMGWRASGLFCFVFLLGGKITDFPILGLALLPLRMVGMARRLAAVAAAAAPVAIWWGLVILLVTVRFHSPLYLPGPLFAGDRTVMLNGPDPAANLHILLHPATRLITLPWATLLAGGVQTLREMIGVLGALQIVFPDAVYLAWGAVLVIAICGLGFVRREAGPRLAEMVFVLALVVATWWVTEITEYIDWSPVGSDRVLGLQGRYLLPVLPMLIFAVPGRRRLPAYAPALPAILLGLFDLAYVPVKLVYFFYLH